MDKPTCLFRPARRSSGNVDEHDRQSVAAESVSQGSGSLYDLVSRVCGGKGDDALLQVDHNQGCGFVDLGEGHCACFGWKVG